MHAERKSRLIIYKSGYKNIFFISNFQFNIFWDRYVYPTDINICANIYVIAISRIKPFDDKK